MPSNRITKIMQFLEEINKFKEVYRATYINDKGRHESDAEHTWHMCMIALLLYDELGIKINIQRAIELILIHDLVEIYAGDTFVYDKTANLDKKEREEKAAEKLFIILPVDLHDRIRKHWDEFEAQESDEARFAKAVDNLQAFFQNVYTNGRLWNEKGITEEKSRKHNSKAIAFDPYIKQIFESLYARADENKLWP